ncbi:hypothetical protein MOQ72_34090 [Saccharopolyspora sp. K220]|uniref:hypothetical protein n=1 Tax=Saccharopolyspora soli TaxID=2926618 RepID=UPI001F57257D|nr:hypothetical protein [Saccharopolyspora soli]MCI2422470.1 hypothetical protein [Saccharopolyspora soli]
MDTPSTRVRAHTALDHAVAATPTQQWLRLAPNLRFAPSERMNPIAVSTTTDEFVLSVHHDESGWTYRVAAAGDLIADSTVGDAHTALVRAELVVLQRRQLTQAPPA